MKKKIILTFDVDGLWAQEQLWNKFDKLKIEKIKKNDPVLKKGINKVLKILKKNNIKATFFVVGNNVKNYTKEHLEIVKEGHEIASHTYSHPVKLSKLSFLEKKNEIEKNENTLMNFLGVKPIGFRAPTYSIDEEILRILDEKNYVYDSSLIPTYIPNFTRINNLFVLRRPHFIRNSNLLEIPISTFLIFPLLGTVIFNLGKNYFNIVSKLIFFKNKPLILNFHIRDFVKIRKGAFWLPSQKKRMNVFNYMIKKLIKNYEFLTLEQFVKDYKL